MGSTIAIILLFAIVGVSTGFIMKAQRAGNQDKRAPKIPVLRTGTAGFLAGVFIGALSSNYLVPHGWWPAGDMPQTFEMAFIGGFIGLVAGVLLAIVFFGRGHSTS